MRRKNTTAQMMEGYIIEAMLLLLKERRFADITVADLTARAGVNRSTYYRHFETREAVVDAYFESIMTAYRAAFAQLETPSFGDYLYTMFAAFYVHRDQLLVLHAQGLTARIGNVLRRQFGLDALVQHTTGSLGQRYKLAYHVGGVINSLLLWFDRGMVETPAQLASITLTFLSAESSSLFG